MRVKAKLRKDDRLWRRMVRNLSKKHNNAIDIGWWNSKHPTGEPVAQIAKWNEEGHMTGTGRFSPMRPFIRRGFMVTLKRNTLNEYNKYIHQIAMGKLTWAALNRILARDLVKSLQETILNWKTPANSPFTVEAKGFNDPLIWTGTMYDTIRTRTVRRAN